MTTIETKITDFNTILNNAESVLDYISEIENQDDLEQISTLIRKVLNHLLEAQETINDRNLDLIRYEAASEEWQANMGNYFEERLQFISLIERREG